MALAAVAFHFNVPDRREYACRLLRKAWRQGARVVVTGTPHALDDLDRFLWTFEPLEFVPHWRAASPDRLPERLRSRTPIVLLDQPDPQDGRAVLVNLGQDVPAPAAQFDRVIEIVGLGDDERAQARQRWRHYTQLGVAIERHDIKTR
jgi:DNA polymerase III subunit chi